MGEMEGGRACRRLTVFRSGTYLPGFPADTDSNRGSYCARRSSNSSLEMLAGDGEFIAATATAGDVQAQLSTEQSLRYLGLPGNDRV